MIEKTYPGKRTLEEEMVTVEPLRVDAREVRREQRLLGEETMYRAFPATADLDDDSDNGVDEDFDYDPLALDASPPSRPKRRRRSSSVSSSPRIKGAAQTGTGGTQTQLGNISTALVRKKQKRTSAYPARVSVNKERHGFVRTEDDIIKNEPRSTIARVTGEIMPLIKAKKVSEHGASRKTIRNNGDLVKSEDDIIKAGVEYAPIRKDGNFDITPFEDGANEEHDKQVVLIEDDDEVVLDVESLSSAGVCKIRQPHASVKATMEVMDDMEDLEFELEAAQIKHRIKEAQEAQLNAKLKEVQLKRRMAAMKKRNAAT